MPDSAQAGPDEQVVATIPNLTLKAGVFGLASRQHTLVITTQRLIFARMTSTRIGELSKDAREQAKSEGKGRMAQYAAQSRAFDDLAASYRAMSPAAILDENPDNFAVARGDISKVKFKQTGDSSGSVSQDVMVIKTTGRTYKLNVMSSVGQARRALAEAGIPVG